MDITLYRCDAFTTTPGKGNPAGVVLDAKDLTEEQMQRIAAWAGYSETAFVLPSDKADLQLRYFTPGKEVPLCGHATVGSMWLLRQQGRIPEGTLQVETKAGVIPVEAVERNGRTQIGMTQVPYQEKPFGGNKKDLMEAIGLTEEDLDPRFPVLYGYTGLWTLMLPIRSMEAFGRMQRQTERFPVILTEEPGASIHPFCLGGMLEGAQIHARHFSSPFTGIGEDPVTGTASGVTGAYYKRYIAPDPSKSYLVVMEQGLEIGTQGIVETAVQEDPAAPPQIFGTAVQVESFALDPDKLPEK